MLCGGFTRLWRGLPAFYPPLAEWRGFSLFSHHEAHEGSRSYIYFIAFFFVVLCLSSKVHPPSLWWVVIGDVLRGLTFFNNKFLRG